MSTNIDDLIRNHWGEDEDQEPPAEEAEPSPEGLCSELREAKAALAAAKAAESRLPGLKRALASAQEELELLDEERATAVATETAGAIALAEAKDAAPDIRAEHEAAAIAAMRARVAIDQQIGAQRERIVGLEEKLTNATVALAGKGA